MTRIANITEQSWETREHSDGSVSVGYWDHAGNGYIPVTLNVRIDCTDLIVAAPELLAALERALPYVRFVVAGQTKRDRANGYAQSALDQVESAIAKAKGNPSP